MYTQEQISELLSLMTLEEKINQLFIIEPGALGDNTPATIVNESTFEALKKHPVGGFIYFENHLENTIQTKEMLSKTKDYTLKATQKILSDGTKIAITPFLSIDEEGGDVNARVASNVAFGISNVGNMCDVKDSDEAYHVGLTLASYLTELGFNLDFAPDADTITNPLNKIIGVRSFGTDPIDVKNKSIALSKGLQDGNCMSCFKHFPGHGATEGDSHLGLAHTTRSLEQLWKEDLIPFVGAKECNSDMVMIAHISVPEILGQDTPCSLSKYIITNLLKERCGFDGLIITDALNMGAIVQNYGADEAALLALEAGVDILLMPDDFKSAYQAVYNAVCTGRIPINRIDYSVEKILITKFKYNK